MIRSNMMKQVTKPPMKKGAKKAQDKNSKNGYAKSGKVDQMQCSPRKQMAMRGV
jgi:hypothetical protein